MVHSSSQKDINNKVIYHKLKRDFEAYFQQKDLYYGSLNDAADETSKDVVSTPRGNGYNINMVCPTP